jgi:hypothetical protein
MSEVLTPERAEQAIQFYLHQLGELVNDYSSAADLRATTEASYRLAHATARTEYRHNAIENGWKTTESIVDDHATIATYDELSARLLAAAREESLKLALRACGSKLDGARSLAANLRSAIG